MLYRRHADARTQRQVARLDYADQDDLAHLPPEDDRAELAEEVVEVRRLPQKNKGGGKRKEWIQIGLEKVDKGRGARNASRHDGHVEVVFGNEPARSGIRMSTPGIWLLRHQASPVHGPNLHSGAAVARCCCVHPQFLGQFPI